MSSCDSTMDLTLADYSNVIHFCEYHDGWNYHKIQVNDERFLHTSNDLLEWLLKNNILRIWDKKDAHLT